MDRYAESRVWLGFLKSLKILDFIADFSVSCLRSKCWWCYSCFYCKLMQVLTFDNVGFSLDIKPFSLWEWWLIVDNDLGIVCRDCILVMFDYFGDWIWGICVMFVGCTSGCELRVLLLTYNTGQFMKSICFFWWFRK